GRPCSCAGDVHGAGQPGGGVGGQVVVVVGEGDGVLDGLVAALAEGRRHGVRGVAEQGDPAAVVGGQRLGDVVDVVPQHVLGTGGGQDGGDRVVPVAVAAQQFGPLVVGGALAGRCEGGGVGVDPAVLEGVGAPEAAAAPGLVRGEVGAGQRDHDSPGGEARVDRARMVGEERPAHRRVDAVGGHHEVGRQLSFGCLDPGRTGGVAGLPGVDEV